MTPGPGPATPRAAAPPNREAHRAFANAGLNLVAGALPIPLALVTIPAVISGFGVDRYGILATAGVVLAYFALLDFGLARATTRFLARSLESGDAQETAAIFWTVVALAALIGVLAAAVLLAIAAPLAREVLRVPPALVGEAVAAFEVLAAAAPFVIVLPTLLSALEGWRRFDLVAAIQVPTVAASLVAPLLVLPWTVHPAAAIAATAVVQAAACGAALVTCLHVAPGFQGGIRVRWRVARQLFGYGRWVAVSNVVSPLMVNADRVAIGATLSVGAVTYYAAPYGLVTQLSLVPSSLMRALFPLFSADRSVDVKIARPLAVDGLRAIALVMGPAAVLLVVIAPDLLRAWLGADFARLSTPSLQLLAIGVTVNALAMVPFWLLYGIGRPDVCAKFHLVELVLYVPMLWLFLGWWGITGAAAAWTARVTLDGVLLAWAVSRLVGAAEYAPRLHRMVAYGVVLAIALVLARLASGQLAAAGLRLASAVALTACATVLGSRLLLTAAERATVWPEVVARLRRGRT